MFGKILEILGEDADNLLNQKCTTIDKEMLALPGPDFIDRIFSATDRPNRVLRNLQAVFNNGRLAGTVVKSAKKGTS